MNLQTIFQKRDKENQEKLRRFSISIFGSRHLTVLYMPDQNKITSLLFELNIFFRLGEDP